VPQGFVPDEGAPQTMLGMLGVPNPGLNTVTLILWVNDFTPDYSVTVADLVEPDFNGYVRYNLDPTLWNLPVANKGCTTTTWGAQPVTWPINAASSNLIYGFALWDRMANLLRWIQRFEPADINPLQVGYTLTLTPTITLTSAACTATMTALTQLPSPQPAGSDRA